MSFISLSRRAELAGSLLAVGGFRTVLAEVVLVARASEIGFAAGLMVMVSTPWPPALPRSPRCARHPRRLAPAERRVSGDQHAGSRQRIAALHQLHNRHAGVGLVIAFDLRGASAARSPARGRENSRRGWCRSRESRGRPAPTRWRGANACAPRRRSTETRGRAPGGWPGPRTGRSLPSTMRPSRSAITMSAGVILSYGTPLGLITTRPCSREMPLALPNV